MPKRGTWLSTENLSLQKGTRYSQGWSQDLQWSRHIWSSVWSGRNQLLLILFHQFYWSFIQNSIYKSLKITSFYKNSLQFSSDYTNTWHRKTFLQIHMFSYKNTLIKKCLYRTYSKFYAFFPHPIITSGFLSEKCLSHPITKL